MRGNLKYFIEKGISPRAAAQIKLSLIHAAVLSCDLNDEPEVGKHLIRTEDSEKFPANELKAREQSIQHSIPVMANALTSTTMGPQLTMPGSNVIVKVKRGLGKNISGDSCLSHEAEFLIPPMQLLYYRKKQDGKFTTYYAQVVNTPDGLTPKQLGKETPKPVKKFGIF
jgi:hypothetical protein